MKEDLGAWAFLRKIDSSEITLILTVLVLAWVLAAIVRWGLRRASEKAPRRLRLPILRVIPLVRLFIGIGAFVLIVPILVEPSFQNVVALLAGVSLAVAFALKEYASSLIAGLVTVLENTYQPGDWIEMDGIYGEVKFIGVRAVHIVTADDNEVIIPHYQLWSKKVSNATSGSHSLLCVADFYLHPDHDGPAVRRRLEEIGEMSSRRQPETKVRVVAQEKPWGTHYKLKAYVKESREQFDFITDLTLRGKAALREMNVRFAQAPYAQGGRK
ncbi:MAG: mechanosensitive ion channel [Betaproteobacteria bacterium]|nr:mechanosensitive ion channel [Betaproteobacteria bacterium]